MGYVRATAVTHRPTGWYPQLHALLLTDRVLTADDLRELHLFVREQWIRRVRGQGLRGPDVHRAIRVLPISESAGMGAHLTRVPDEESQGSTPGLELARSGAKTGRGGGGRSPFRILEDHERRGDPADWRLFREWLVVAKGRRTWQWSRGLRALLLPDHVDDVDDPEPAVAVAAISPDVWREIVSRRLSVAALEAVEARGLGGLVVLLRTAGLPVEVERHDPHPPQLVLEAPKIPTGYLAQHHARHDPEGDHDRGGQGAEDLGEPAAEEREPLETPAREVAPR